MMKLGSICALAAVLASTNVYAGVNGNLLPPVKTPKISQIFVENPHELTDHMPFEVAAANTIGPRGGGEVYLYLY